MRKSIFDIVSEKLDMKGDTNRLFIMAKEEKTLCLTDNSYYSLFQFVDEFCFKDWAHRSRYINLDDFLNALNFTELVATAKSNMEAHLTLIELIYNFWYLAHSMFDDRNFKGILKWCGNFYHLKDVMDEILEEYNHTVYTNEDKDYFIVVENKPEATAAAEIMPTPELSFDVIRYNHRSLKGDIEAKKTILIRFGAELEARRKELKNIDNRLTKDIFYMLNNVNIRHNNCSPEDRAKYNEYVAAMNPDELEEWYDELYQMMLLAFLLMDNRERAQKVSELTNNINRGKKNGQAENAHAE